MNHWKIAFTMTMAGACLALGLQAAQAAGRHDRTCAEDAKKFCSEVKPGGGKLVQCLSSHEAELAPACSERLKAGKARMEEFVAACKPDVEKLCKGTEPGSGHVLQCLKGHEAELSAGCKSQFSKSKHNRAATQ
ncbi:MAG: cysteine rich repeat-containing protein [Burkholderiales bacterium]